MEEAAVTVEVAAMVAVAAAAMEEAAVTVEVAAMVAVADEDTGAAEAADATNTKRRPVPWIAINPYFFLIFFSPAYV